MAVWLQQTWLKVGGVLGVMSQGVEEEALTAQNPNCLGSKEPCDFLVQSQSMDLTIRGPGFKFYSSP